MNAEQQIRYLQIELEKARQEASRLRKALGENSKHARRIDKAYEDALLLATFYAAGIIPSRRYARLKGLTQNRWENATALLKMARIIERHQSNQNDLKGAGRPLFSSLTILKQRMYHMYHM